MKFSDVKNRTCLYLLGGIAGLEGSVLNIITTKDDKLFFEFCNVYDELGLDEDTMYAFPIEAYLPIYILQETTMKEIENILSEASLSNNDNRGPFLNEIMQLESNPIYLEKELDGNDTEYLETSWNDKNIQSRMEHWVKAWPRLNLLDVLNWNFDYKPKDKTILQLVLEDMARTED